jgi:RimJ/RimL family protein N-acetyltransferase
LRVPIQPPAPDLSDGEITLVPLSAADVDEIALFDDVEGFRELAMGHQISRDQIRHEVATGIHGWLFKDVASPPRTHIRWSFSVRLGVDRGLVGMIGFEWFTLARSGRPKQDPPAIAVAYWTSPKHRCRGFATRALALSTPWALRAFTVDEIWLRPNNQSSARVAEKAGYVLTNRKLNGARLYRSPPP